MKMSEKQIIQLSPRRIYTRGNPYERVIAHVIVDLDLGCWVYGGARTQGGYGNVRVDGRNRHAHIVTYEHVHGPIPDGLELDHMCRVRPCCNPYHVEPVSHAENVRRGLSPGRSCDHPEQDVYRRRSGPRRGQMAYCRGCRRERRRRERS